MPEFQSKVLISAPRRFAFRWHEAEGAFQRLTPPWERITLESKQGSIENGYVALKNRVGPFAFRMRAQHSNFVQDEQFYDEMSGGPFKSWRHWHLFEDAGDQTQLTDRIEYRLRGMGIGNFLGGRYAAGKLRQLFAYRHKVTQTDIEDHFQFHDQPRRTIAVTGATGLVGKAVCEFLSCGGHRVIPLSRSKSVDNATEPCWNPETGQVYFGEDISTVDSFVHLAGYGIADHRWNEKVKSRIHTSRVDATNALVTRLLNEDRVKNSFVAASAIGFYGDRGEETLTEDSNRGDGFLAETCEPWENASLRMNSGGVRAVVARFGMILSGKGGALKSMLMPFRFGAGGRVGSGKQIWSWISLYDTIRAIHFSLMSDKLSGPVNFTTPNPVSQKQFAKTLGKVLFRPSFMPLPAFAARLVLGEMADHLLLASSNVLPEKLVNCGFNFIQSKLEDALRFELGRIQTKSNH